MPDVRAKSTGRGKKTASLHEVKPVTLVSGLLQELPRRNPNLPPQYVALTVQRVVMIVPDEGEAGRGRWPDVGVVADDSATPAGGVATVAPPLAANAKRAETIPLYGVEIHDPESRRLVTAIEILSPVNKRGSRDEYAAKRQELLAGPANLVDQRRMPRAIQDHRRQIRDRHALGFRQRRQVLRR